MFVEGCRVKPHPRFNHASAVHIQSEGRQDMCQNNGIPVHCRTQLVFSTRICYCQLSPILHCWYGPILYSSEDRLCPNEAVPSFQFQGTIRACLYDAISLCCARILTTDLVDRVYRNADTYKHNRAFNFRQGDR